MPSSCFSFFFCSTPYFIFFFLLHLPRILIFLWDSWCDVPNRGFDPPQEWQSGNQALYMYPLSCSIRQLLLHWKTDASCQNSEKRTRMSISNFSNTCSSHLLPADEMANPSAGLGRPVEFSSDVPFILQTKKRGYPVDIVALFASIRSLSSACLYLPWPQSRGNVVCPVVLLPCERKPKKN
jgi:hypothetical protein